MKGQDPKCRFPNCVFHPQKNGYCIHHQAYASFKSVKIAERPAKQSDTRKEEEKLYKKIVQQMAAVSNKCEIKSPVCTKIMEGLHHMKRRGINYLNKNFLKRACNPCNRYLEEHPGWAKKNDHSISRHENQNNITGKRLNKSQTL